MAVDVSGLTSALISVPGQNVANIQGTLERAYQEKQQALQQQFQNDLVQQKTHLAQQVALGELGVKQLETNAKQTQFVGDWAKGLIVTKDPSQRELLLQDGITQAQKLGIPPEGQAAMVKAFKEPEFAGSLIARSMGTNEFYKQYLADNSNKDASQAQKKYQELVARAKELGNYVPGVTERTAEGIAYGTYKTTTDSATGDVVLTDTRMAGGRAPANEVSHADILGGVPSPAASYRPIRVTPGNKKELKLQDDVKSLSQSMIKAGIPDMESMLQPVEATIADTYGKGKGLPGYGLGTTLTPDLWMDQQSKDFRQDVKKLFNTVLHIRSGSAVVQQELERLQEEYGTGTFKTASQLVHAIGSARRILELQKQAEFAGYGPDVVEQYQKQGGVKTREIPQSTAPSAPKSNVPTSASQVRADAKKYGWNEDQVQGVLKKFNLKE